MMWGNEDNMGSGWGWLVGLLLLLGIVLLVIWALRAGAARRDGQRYGSAGDLGSRGPSAARQILDERFARGELEAEEYRQRLTVLGEKAK
jgi:putative membrane protein